MFGRIYIPLLRAEVAAARLEAVLSSDPGVEALWRAEAGIAEAVASVGMEDVKILEGDLLVKIAENRTTKLDSRGVETAWSVLRFLRAPGDIIAEPIETVRRIERACGNQPSENEYPVSDDEILEIFDAIKGLEDVPVAASIRASAIYGILTQRRSPAVERLIFCAVDAALRGRARAPRYEAEDAEIHHLHPLGRSGPIVMPATATARAGRIVWSPLRLGSVTDLAEALAHGISYDLGHIGLLRAQVANLRKAGEGRHGKSRIGDLADWLMTHPVITSGSVMKGLGLSRRGALDMIATLEAEGMLKQVTYRKTARIWATTSLADRLKRRTAYGTAPGAGLTEKKAATTEGQDTVQDVSGLGRQRHLREENKETVSAAMAAMDAAMAEADRLLAGIGQGRIDPED